MNKLIKYTGWGVGILLLLVMIFPSLFLPAGVICGFALGIFVQTCAKNVSGATKIYIAEKSVASSFTVAGNLITAIGGTTPFNRVDAMQDSVSWQELGERVGLNNWKITNTIEFDVMPPATLTNTFLQALIDGSPCGFFAIILDGNAKAWVAGFNETDIRDRPLRLSGQDHKTGKGLAEAEGNTVRIKLTNECGGLAIQLDPTLTAMVVAGSGSILKVA